MITSKQITQCFRKRPVDKGPGENESTCEGQGVSGGPGLFLSFNFYLQEYKFLLIKTAYTEDDKGIFHFNLR